MKREQPRHSALGSALTEVVNLRTGTVRVTGDLTGSGARSLCGTVRTLQQEGHERVVLDLVGVGLADDEGRAVLDDLGRLVTDAGGELRVLWGSHELRQVRSRSRSAGAESHDRHEAPPLPPG